jgi:hypothetical protein
VQRLPLGQLQQPAQQEEIEGKIGLEQVLQEMPEAHGAQRSEVIFKRAARLVFLTGA